MKSILAVSVFVILFLDYAALDDITTGNEPSLTGEYLILAISIPLLLLLFWGLIWKARIKK